MLVIANPIYDLTFKMIMENQNAAKNLISTILGCEILSMTQTNVERNFEDVETRMIRVQRMDYSAEIVTQDEEPKKVLIEVQKSSDRGDLMRFRRYLGVEYVKTDLPLITIYILGFDIDIEAPIAMTPPYCLNMLTNEIIYTTEEYYKLLHHTAYFIQTKRIEDRHKTLLDNLLSIFRQGNFIDDTTRTLKYLNISEVDPKLKDIIDILTYIAADPELKDKLKAEQESAQFFEDSREPYKRQIMEKEKALEETTKALEDTTKALEESKKAQEDTTKALASTVRLLHKNGTQLPEIAIATGLTIADIEKLLDE